MWSLTLELRRQHHEHAASDLRHEHLPRPTQAAHVLVACAGVEGELHHALQMAWQSWHELRLLQPSDRVELLTLVHEDWSDTSLVTLALEKPRQHRRAFLSDCIK